MVGVEVLYQLAIMLQESLELGLLCQLVKHGEDAQGSHMVMQYTSEAVEDYIHAHPEK
tara:strand:- start:851 stop:1024 length:174 start_codon:yes stop_codon:yes gene_type:complete